MAKGTILGASFLLVTGPSLQGILGPLILRLLLVCACLVNPGVPWTRPFLGLQISHQHVPSLSRNSEFFGGIVCACSCQPHLFSSCLFAAPRVEVVGHPCLCTPRDRSHSHGSVTESSELQGGWIGRRLSGQSCSSGILLLFQLPQNLELDFPGLADFKPQGFQLVRSAKTKLCSLSGHLLPGRRAGNSHGQPSLNLAHSKCSRNRLWCEYHI